MKASIFRKNLAILLCFILIFTAMSLSFSVNAQSLGGTEANGISTQLTDCYSTDNTELPVNLDFSGGFKYWTSKSNRTGYASDFMSLVRDTQTGDYMVGTKSGKGLFDGITTVGFKMGGYTKIALMFKAKVNPKLSKTVFETYNSNCPISVHLVNASSNSVIASFQDFGSITADTANGGWFNCFAFSATVKVDTYYAVMIQQQVSASRIAAACNGESPYWLKDFRIVAINSNGTYTDILTNTNLYKYGQQVGGTETDGVGRVYSQSGAVYPGMSGSPYGIENYPALSGLKNGDFSGGFKYWALKNDCYGKTATDGTLTVGKISEIASVSDGTVTFKPFDAEKNANLGIQSMPFNLLGYTVEGDRVYFSVEHLNQTPMSFNIYSANGNFSKKNIVSSVWKTTYLEPVTVNDVYSAYALEIVSDSNGGGAQFKNVRVYRADRGGLSETRLVNINGTLLAGDSYGDANADGKVDLADLVRVKKCMAFSDDDFSVPIFLSAADINGSNCADAEDATHIINYILSGTTIPEHNGVIIFPPDSENGGTTSGGGYVELPDIEF